MKNKLVLWILCLSIGIQACDKVEAPYGEAGTPPAQNSVTINAGSIPGSFLDYTVNSATESDTSLLSATWYYSESGDTSFASIIFKWNGQKSDSIKSITTPIGPVHFDDTLSIAAGSPYGTLTFHYIADITSAGSGDATVIVIIANSQAVKKVLLFDFTGHQCQFCPRGARIATSLHAIYGEQLVVMAVHCGSFSNVNATGMYTYDFRTPEGNQLCSDFGISNFPNGSINFITKNGSILIPYTSWGSVVPSELSKAPAAQISVTPTFNATNRELTAEVSSSFITSRSGNYNLAVYLIEDSIINWQLDFDANPQDNPNYVHNHVLRTSFSGTYGELLASNPAAGSSFNKQYTLTLNNGYNEKHCAIVAFVFDAVTKEIIQVEEMKLFP